jgi:hypothetical protein
MLVIFARLASDRFFQRLSWILKPLNCRGGVPEKYRLAMVEPFDALI